MTLALQATVHLVGHLMNAAQAPSDCQIGTKPISLS